MLSLYLNKPAELELKEIPSVTQLQGDEVKIKLICGGICGSDVAVYKGKLPHAIYPVRPGHELVGTIIEVGEKAEFKVGTRVVIGPNTFCGECVYCLQGKKNICEQKASIGVNKDGGFSEEFVISSKFVMPVPDYLTDEQAVLIEPFSVIVHALDKVDIKKGTSVAIIGCGTEGVLAVSLAHYLGADITAIDINEEKLKKVRKSFLGADSSLPNDVPENKFDVVVEAAGAASAVVQAIDIVKPGGKIVLIGMAAEANLPIVQIVRKEITMHGSIIYNFPDDFQKSVEFLSQDNFNAEPVISKIYPFKQYAQAYDDALSGKFGKIILKFREED